MAVARGSHAATGQMVICTGEGAITVYTDAQGRPTSAPHICPDCIVLMNPQPEEPPLVLGGRLLPAQISPIQRAVVIPSGDRTGFLSRAPPVHG